MKYYNNIDGIFHYKNYFIINKFFYNDNTDENKLLFIPPISPYLLLYLRGEYWHVRTKISIKFSSEKDIKNKIFGLLNGTVNNIPDFININTQYSDITFDDLNLLLQQIIKNNSYQLFEKYYFKYLKYKIKYLKLNKI
jgi:hypothetical protein